MNEKQAEPDYNKPVAYDVDGRPLYAHPAEMPIQTVQLVRPAEPLESPISEAAKAKHARSKKMYPNLNLSEGEYVIKAIKRHPIGLVGPLALGLSLITISLFILFDYENIARLLQIDSSTAGFSLVVLPVTLFAVLTALVTYIAYYIYTNNHFYLTNESVIQEIQTGLFARHEQTVSLSNIEDASYYQKNIINQIFDYGLIRLSTEGDETTYRFSYVAQPKKNLAILNNAIEAFKNGHPIDDNEDLD